MDVNPLYTDTRGKVIAQSLYDAYENPPEVRFEKRSNPNWDYGDVNSSLFYRVKVVDFTKTNIDPQTARHITEMDSLQSRYDTINQGLISKDKSFQSQTKTFGDNLFNLAQLDRQGVVDVVDNNFNLILISVIMYFLFRG